MTVELTGSYRHLLAAIHKNVRPRTYVEIGVASGESFRLVRHRTVAIGIDPDPRLRHKPPKGAQIHAQTSDEFFAEHDLRRVLSAPVDLAFIDGMHHFEVALRDFRNIERNAERNSVVLIHDCYPPAVAWASREPRSGGWAGDVWKLISCLSDYRPDLQVAVAAANPTGLGIVSGLDPNNNVLFERYDEIVAKYMPLTVPAFHGATVLEGTWTSIAPLFPPPFRPRGPFEQVAFMTKRLLRRTPVGPPLARFARRMKSSGRRRHRG